MLIFPGPWASCLFANSPKEDQWSRSISPPPPQTIKGVLNIRNGVGIFAGDGVDAPIVTQKRYEPSGFLARQTGDAQGESDGSMTPAASISATRSSSAVPGAREGRRGGCRIGVASAVSMSCSRRLQNPMSVGDLAKTSLCVMRRSLKFEARVGDNLASWSVVRNRTRRCSGTSESRRKDGRAAHQAGRT